MAKWLLQQLDGLGLLLIDSRFGAFGAGLLLGNVVVQSSDPCLYSLLGGLKADL